jgi:hypothetical protein
MTTLESSLETVIEEIRLLKILVDQLQREVRRGVSITVVNTGPVPGVYVPEPKPWPGTPITPCDEPYRVTCDSALPGEDKCVRCESTMEMSGKCASHQPVNTDPCGAIFPH